MIQCSSDPNSTLNRLRVRLHEANKAMGGSGDKSKAATERNHALANLRRYAHKLRGKPTNTERHDPHHETTIHGIPCGIVVESYKPGRPRRQHTFPGAGPGDCDPPEPAECEWFVVDRRGYRADWLLDKLTPKDVREIEQEMGI